jgi:hypothetical protein
MTATAHESCSPQILDIWDRYITNSDRYYASMRAEQDRLGRSIYRSTTGFTRREEVIGLQDTSSEPPEGWTKLAKNDFLTPSRGRVGQRARDWLQDHQPPRSIGQLLAEFGVKEAHVSEGRVYWPGLERLAGGLYVTWGVDTGWDGGEHFDQVPLSAYYAVREAVAAAIIAPGSPVTAMPTERELRLVARRPMS